MAVVDRHRSKRIAGTTVSNSMHSDTRSIASKIEIVLVALMAICVFNACSSGRADGPAPGSPAAEMCDTNDRGAHTVEYKGVRYVRKCLRAYSWEPR